MTIDPAQPYIEEICVLTEALEEALRASHEELARHVAGGGA